MSLNSTTKYLSLIKFSHTIFALPFAFVGFVWAYTSSETTIDTGVLFYILLCMITARSCAMSFNRIVDAKFDKLNERTAIREIPSGQISAKNATIFTIVNALLFVICSAMINKLTLLLSPVALIIILGYSLMKRVSWLCHYVLGLALGITPVAAYISATGKFDLFTIIVSLIVMTWVSSFDILYSLQDEEFDRRNNLHSIPVLLGRRGALIVSASIHLVTIIFVILLGQLYNLNYIYWIGATIFSIMLTIEHTLVTPQDISRVNLAFATLNSLGSVVYCIMLIISLLVD